MIGEGYERLMNPKTVPEEDDYKFHGRQPTAFPIQTAPYLRVGR